jgi:hypothetical protein
MVDNEGTNDRGDISADFTAVVKAVKATGAKKQLVRPPSTQWIPQIARPIAGIDRSCRRLTYGGGAVVAAAVQSWAQRNCKGCHLLRGPYHRVWRHHRVSAFSLTV